MGRKIPDTVTEDEIKELVKHVKKPKTKLAYLLGFYQCMRISEVVKLTKDDIDFNRRLILIKQAKGGKDRHVPIAPEVMKGLKHLPVKVGVRALQISFKKISNEVLQKDLHFHSLRHSGATHYLNVKKWNLRQLQQFLGHANINTTQIYTHVSPQDLLDQMWGGD